MMMTVTLKHAHWMLKVHAVLVEMLVGGTSLEIVNDLRLVASSVADCSFHGLLTDAVTSVVTTVR